MHVSLSPARRAMGANEWEVSALPRGDHGTGTQGSPVGRRSRLFDVDREQTLSWCQIPGWSHAKRQRTSWPLSN